MCLIEVYVLEALFII